MDFFSLPTRSRPFEKATTEKMDKRFSQLFILPTQAPKNNPTTPEQDSQPSPPKKQSPKQNLKHFFRRLLPSTNDAAATHLPPASEEQLWVNLLCPSINTPITIKALPAPNNGNPTSQLIPQPQPQPPTRKSITLRKQKPQSTITIHPPHPPYPSFTRTSIFPSTTKTHRAPGTNKSIRRPDSKFSSISSLPSLALSHPSTTSFPLSILDFKRLQSGVRRIKRGLRQQEYLTGHLSKNLLFLFGRKERQLLGYGRGRVRGEARTDVLGELFRVKEQTRKTFLRKAVLLQKSLGAWGKLERTLDEVKGKGGGGERIQELVGILREDLNTQRELDGAFKSRVLGKCGERWGGSENERIMIRRFVVFVEGRLGVLEGCYGRIEGVADRMGEVLGAERS